MKLLNVGCGATRPDHPWVNMDTVKAQLLGMIERREPGSHAAALAQVESEPNYIEHNMDVLPWPFATDCLDGILLSHVLEHFDMLGALSVLRECLRILRPGGTIRVSVPDATVFQAMYPVDKRERAQQLFGEPIGPDEPTSITTFMQYALFFPGHKQVFSAPSLWCHLAQVGFKKMTQLPARVSDTEDAKLAELDNRPLFSLFMEARKPS